MVSSTQEMRWMEKRADPRQVEETGSGHYSGVGLMEVGESRNLITRYRYLSWEEAGDIEIIN